MRVLSDCAFSDDARIQRDVSRAFATLSQSSDIQSEMATQSYCLPAVLVLAKSLDVACQRYSTLTLCNLCSSIEHKVRLVKDGIVRPLVFLSRFPDVEIQKYSAMALAGLTLGGHGSNKAFVTEEGCIKPLVDLLRLPELQVQLSALLAVNCIVLGHEQNTKSIVMSELGLDPIIHLANKPIEVHDSEFVPENVDVVSTAIYCLGSLAEHADVRARLVELGAIGTVVRQCGLGHMDIKRAAGYFLGTMCEISEFHVDLEREGALPAIINLATMEDIECQEYAAFCLAHLSSNKDYQVKLVNNLGVVRPLVAMLSSDAEPKHYAGLALLKLADNFENHLKIAEEGGIQALLRLGRTRSTDEQLQYKAALTVGQLASNAVKLLPQKERAGMAGVPGVTDKAIGHGVRVLGKLRDQANNTQKGKDITTNYLDKSLKQSKQQMDDDEALRRSETSARKGRGNGSDQIGDLVTKTALKIGVEKDK